MVYNFQYDIRLRRVSSFELAQALFVPFLGPPPFVIIMEASDEQNQQNQQNQQSQQNQQNQNQQQQSQQERQSSRKRITKTPPNDSGSGSNKRPSGNSGGNGGSNGGSNNNNDQPPVPERTSSFPDSLSAEGRGKNNRRKGRSGSTPNTNEDSGAALTAAEILRMGGAELPGEDSNGGGGAELCDDGEDSEATEFGEGSELVGEPSSGSAQAPSQQGRGNGGIGGNGGQGQGGSSTAPEPSPNSFAARKGKGKDKDNKRQNSGGKKNKDKGAAGGGQDGKQQQSAPEGGNGGGSGKQEGKKNDNGGGKGNNGGGQDENLADYPFTGARFIEGDMDSNGEGHNHDHDHGDFHDFDHNHGHSHGHAHGHGHGHGHGHNHGQNHGHNHEGESNVINIDAFPANSRGPPNNNNSSSAASAFASITHTLAGMVPLPRAPRDDYMRTMSNDRRSLQETVQSLYTALQHEQMRRLAAEESIGMLQENLNVYKDLANQYREEANKMREETERSKKGHMQVLRDLNRFKAGQGFSQMSDDILTQMARGLRQDIRDFSLQYFDGEFEDDAKNTHPPKREDSKLGEFMTGISPLDPYQSFLLSPTRCSAAIESFLWVILAKTVFGGWYWAGGGRLPLHDVFAWMRPVDFSFAVYNDESDTKDAGNAADPEAERRFYTWRATTAKLVAERPGIMVRDTLRNKLIDEICATIQPYLRPANDKSHRDELTNIINKAVDFDCETSQQASRLEWIFCRHPGQTERGEPMRFNPDVMDIQMWEDDPTDQSEVLLVLAPGLRKRGRSNGEDYSVETMLLKMDVTCDPVSDMIVGSKKQ